MINIGQSYFEDLVKMESAELILLEYNETRNVFCVIQNICTGRDQMSRHVVMNDVFTVEERKTAPSLFKMSKRSRFEHDHPHDSLKKEGWKIYKQLYKT